MSETKKGEFRASSGHPRSGTVRSGVVEAWCSGGDGRNTVREHGQIVVKHYSAWIESRQKPLDDAVEKANAGSSMKG